MSLWSSGHSININMKLTCSQYNNHPHVDLIKWYCRFNWAFGFRGHHRVDCSRSKLLFPVVLANHKLIKPSQIFFGLNLIFNGVVSLKTNEFAGVKGTPAFNPQQSLVSS